jgi:hypothetical protein
MIPKPGKHILLIALQLLAIYFSSASGSDDLSTFANDSILSLSGTAFMDEEGDGFLSANETGLVDVTVRLMQDGSLKASTLTGQDGQYIFANLSPGSYRLEADPVAGSSQTAPGGGDYTITLADKSGSGLDFGFFFSRDLTAARPVPDHPLMRPTPSEAALWSSQYNTSAKAILSRRLWPGWLPRRQALTAFWISSITRLPSGIRGSAATAGHGPARA